MTVVKTALATIFSHSLASLAWLERSARRVRNLPVWQHPVWKFVEPGFMLIACLLCGAFFGALIGASVSGATILLAALPPGPLTTENVMRVWLYLPSTLLTLGVGLLVVLDEDSRDRLTSLWPPRDILHLLQGVCVAALICLLLCFSFIMFVAVTGVMGFVATGVLSGFQITTAFLLTPMEIFIIWTRGLGVCGALAGSAVYLKRYDS